jgi:hypothetical protein
MVLFDIRVDKVSHRLNAPGGVIFNIRLQEAIDQKGLVEVSRDTLHFIRTPTRSTKKLRAFKGEVVTESLLTVRFVYPTKLVFVEKEKHRRTLSVHTFCLFTPLSHHNKGVKV